MTKSYYPLETLQLIAGTGPFNGSLVRPFLDRLGNQLPYEAISVTRSFIEDPNHSISLQPPSCAGSTGSCTSYLLPGGTSLIWPPMNISIPPDLVVSLEDAPAMRLDFAKGLSAGDAFFHPSDCKLYGEGDISVTFCLAKSAVHNGSLKAGESSADERPETPMD